MKEKVKREIKIIGALCKKENRNIPPDMLKDCLERNFCPFGNLEKCTDNNSNPLIKIKCV